MARKASAEAVKAPARNGTGAAQKDLLARAARNTDGACQIRSDPLSDAKAAHEIVAAVRAHAAELERRGLTAAYAEAALLLAGLIEGHLQALPAAAINARGRSAEHAELLADAANTVLAVRTAVLRVTREARGREIAHDFGLGEPFSARQPTHVLRAIRRILAAARHHPAVIADLGLLPEDLRTLEELAADLEKLPEAGAPASDEQQRLFEAQAGLRAFFDLFAAKASIAFAEDRDERAKLLALVPRTGERRQR